MALRFWNALQQRIQSPFHEEEKEEEEF